MVLMRNSFAVRTASYVAYVNALSCRQVLQAQTQRQQEVGYHMLGTCSGVLRFGLR